MAIEIKNDFPTLDGRTPRAIGFTPGAALSKKNGFLESLPPALFHEIAPFLKERPLERGQVLHETGAPIAEVCLPLTGAISLHQLLPDGAAILVALVGTGRRDRSQCRLGLRRHRESRGCPVAWHGSVYRGAGFRIRRGKVGSASRSGVRLSRRSAGAGSTHGSLQYPPQRPAAYLPMAASNHRCRRR